MGLTFGGSPRLFFRQAIISRLHDSTHPDWAPSMKLTGETGQSGKAERASEETCVARYSRVQKRRAQEIARRMTIQRCILRLMLWGGRTTDKHLTENSGFLELLTPGVLILAGMYKTV